MSTATSIPNRRALTRAFTHIGDKRRAGILAVIAEDRARFIALAPQMADAEKARQLMAGLGQLAGYCNSATHFGLSKSTTLTRLAAHCIGWVESKGRGVDVFELIDHERQRQRQLFEDGVLLFRVESPAEPEAHKLGVLGEELGEICETIDRLAHAHARREWKGRRLDVKTCGLELCAELTQFAAVAVAWLESFENGGGR